MCSEFQTLYTPVLFRRTQLSKLLDHADHAPYSILAVSGTRLGPTDVTPTDARYPHITTPTTQYNPHLT